MGEKEKYRTKLKKKIRIYYSRVCAIIRQNRKSLKHKILDGEMSQVTVTDKFGRVNETPYCPSQVRLTCSCMAT